MTVFIYIKNLNIHDVSYHDYEGVMSVLCTPLQVKCNHIFALFCEYEFNKISDSDELKFGYHLYNFKCG